MAFLLFASIAHGACHLYVVPQIGSGQDDPRPWTDTTGKFRPKYADQATKWGGVRYGSQGYYLISADVTPAQDTAVSAQVDVIRLPDNLDTQIGAALTTVKNKLEAVKIPAGWITAQTTYRNTLRIIVNMMLFVQRFAGANKFYSALMVGSINLDTTFNSLSSANQTRLLNTAKSLSFDTTSLSGASTLRQILKAMADQFGNKSIVMSCLTI